MADPSITPARLAAAALGVALRALVGGALGAAFGVAVFAVARGAGWLDDHGPLGRGVWALAPAMAVVAGAAGARVGVSRGLRAALRAVLLDGGLARRLAERAEGAGAADALALGAPRGLLGRAVRAALAALGPALDDAPDRAEALAAAWIDDLRATGDRVALALAAAALAAACALL